MMLTSVLMQMEDLPDGPGRGQSDKRKFDGDSDTSMRREGTCTAMSIGRSRVGEQVSPGCGVICSR